MQQEYYSKFYARWSWKRNAMWFAQWLTYSHCVAVPRHSGWNAEWSSCFQRNYAFPPFTIPLHYFLFNYCLRALSWKDHYQSLRYKNYSNLSKFQHVDWFIMMFAAERVFNYGKRHFPLHGVVQLWILWCL